MDEFIEPETNDYMIVVRLCAVRKCEAAALAEVIAVLAEHQLPGSPVAMSIAHLKYDY